MNISQAFRSDFSRLGRMVFILVMILFLGPASYAGLRGGLLFGLGLGRHRWGPEVTAFHLNVSSRATLRPSFGLFEEFKTKGSVSLRAEAVIATTGLKYEEEEYDSNGNRLPQYNKVWESLTSVQVPLLIGLKMPPRGSVRAALFAGPALGIPLDYRVKRRYADGAYVGAYNNDATYDVYQKQKYLDSGFVVAYEAEISARAKDVFLEIRFYYGGHPYKGQIQTDLTGTNTVGSLMLGYRVPWKKLFGTTKWKE